MLLPEQLQTFFEEYKIPLEGSVNLTPEEISILFLEALKVCQSFGRFLLAAVINSNRNGLETGFSSWDNLYECYAAFCTGLMGLKC